VRKEFVLFLPFFVIKDDPSEKHCLSLVLLFHDPEFPYVLQMKAYGRFYLPTPQNQTKAPQNL